MTTYNTNNPIGSADPRDLYDNAENLDKAVNTKTDLRWDDRLGVERKTFYGMECEFTTSMQSMTSAFNTFLASAGYQDIGVYASGMVISARNQIFLRNGEYYRASAALELPYTTTGNWSTEGANFVALGDAVLRQDLANKTNSSLGASLVGFSLPAGVTVPFDRTVNNALESIFGKIEPKTGISINNSIPRLGVIKPPSDYPWQHGYYLRLCQSSAVSANETVIKDGPRAGLSWVTNFNPESFDVASQASNIVVRLDHQNQRLRWRVCQMIGDGSKY